MAPNALKKAESLVRFARHCGSPLTEFAVAVTLGEAYELLDYLGEQNDNPLLREDILQAKARCDPWLVLEHFQIQGLSIARLDALH